MRLASSARPGRKERRPEPGPGVIFFAAVVVLTKSALDWFDPRLIRDSANLQEEDSNRVSYA